ncbi:hypothetical protein BC940DRAFT_367232 [Gongronella butleri]|nr:hypothetical protein BC940DRAFT_367232 [Gongronella butleri]
MSAWFYIQNTITGHVISASRLIEETGVDAVRSQVHVYPCHQTDAELWQWDGQYIRNKATSLVLDVRKGRLRLIEDTDICLYPAKPLDQAHNQLWGTATASHPSGQWICSLSYKDWVLMQVNDKLVLYPHEPTLDDPDHANVWQWIPQDEWISTGAAAASSASATNHYPIAASTTNHQAMPNLSTSADTIESEFPPQGLSPAKRGSQGSVHLPGYSIDQFKDYHDRLYIDHDAQLSDKAMSMAIAYHTWSHQMLDPIREMDDEDALKDKLLMEAQRQAKTMLLTTEPHHHKEDTVINLTTRYVNQLYEQKVSP